MCNVITYGRSLGELPTFFQNYVMFASERGLAAIYRTRVLPIAATIAVKPSPVALAEQ